MKSKLFTIAALAFFAFAVNGPARALDGHEKADMSEAKAEATAEMAASAEAETAAEAATTEETSEAEVTVKKDAKASFEEKVAEYNEDKDDKEKVICRREKRTGSHFSRRRCVTASQAKREREDAQEALQRASRGTNSGPIN